MRLPKVPVLNVWFSQPVVHMGEGVSEWLRDGVYWVSWSMEVMPSRGM